MLYTLDAPVAPPPPPEAPPPRALPRVWIDGDGCPRAAKDLVFRAAQRGACDVVLVANREVAVPRSSRVQTLVVRQGLDVADDTIVARARPDDLVVTSDVPLAAELVRGGVIVISPRGERFDPSNIGERLAIRDWMTEARASGMVEGGGPPPFDERAKKAFADALQGWLDRRRRALDRQGA
ncbi:MAG TPA: YaiI/YqxD family protein [Myxococcota bacterium]|nr:YaiI/YqxD family protein [Myxococcota bacterium]